MKRIVMAMTILAALVAGIHVTSQPAHAADPPCSDSVSTKDPFPYYCVDNIADGEEEVVIQVRHGKYDPWTTFELPHPYEGRLGCQVDGSDEFVWFATINIAEDPPTFVAKVWHQGVDGYGFGFYLLDLTYDNTSTGALAQCRVWPFSVNSILQPVELVFATQAGSQYRFASNVEAEFAGGPPTTTVPTTPPTTQPGGGNQCGAQFVDVPGGHTFCSSIEWLAAEGITVGCNPPSNTKYCPSDFVSRGQMAAFLTRAMSLLSYNGPDRFVDDNDSVFEGAIERLAQAGITLGCNPPNNTRFCPEDFVTRGQMAAFLKRALG